MCAVRAHTVKSQVPELQTSSMPMPRAPRASKKSRMPCKKARLTPRAPDARRSECDLIGSSAGDCESARRRSRRCTARALPVHTFANVGRDLSRAGAVARGVSAPRRPLLGESWLDGGDVSVIVLLRV